MTMVQDGASSSHLAGQADQGPARTKRYLGLLLGLVVLIGLYITSRYSYLLFHSLAELFSIVVAGGMFMVVWNARRFMDNNYLLFIAVAYLFVAGLDFIHMLAYKGMGVFTGSGGNLSTQLWIAARSLQAVSLLIAPFLLGRHINLRLVAAAYAVVFSLVLAAVFWWDVFPVCFVEGQGLTWFKVISEYVISAMLIGALVALYFRRGHFERRVWGLLAASIILTIGSELAFTFYISVYGFSNTMGHFFKIVAFYLVYRAIIQTGLEEPYGLMFRELEQSQEAIQEKEQQIRLILSSTAEGIYGLDLQGNCTFCNPAGLRMLGYDSEAEFLGQNMHDLAHHTRPDGTPYPEKECTIYRAFKERRGTHVDDEVLWRKDGTSFPAEYWSYPIWQDDQVVGSVVTFLDITHRKQAEEALRESTKELDIRNRIARIFLTVPDEE
ncbi:MAG: PAS domain S-box protein, partial [Proteobacteria bacterium]|nr:PAS domain S-box protein [Pseudomonadota bacterium]